MKRVAALWLPDWSIDRIVRAEPTLAPPPERAGVADRNGLDLGGPDLGGPDLGGPDLGGPDLGGPDLGGPDLGGLVAAAQAEKVLQCDAPGNSGWRPGARWARGGGAESTGPSRRDVGVRIAALPHHRRPPTRLPGRSSEATDHPFSRAKADDGGTPDTKIRRGSNDPHSTPPGITAFLDTTRKMDGLVGRISRESLGPCRTEGSPGIVLVTLHKVGARVEVAAASPAARALGIEPGMASTQVRASVPDAIVRDADPDGDAADLHRLAVSIARRWTPVVATSDADGLFLDLTGVAHLHGGEAPMMARLLRLLARAGITARAGIADTAGAAWALARFVARPIASCPPDAQAAVLAPLPAAALRLPEPTLALFRRLGIETVGDVIGLPRAPFTRRFGMGAARRLDQALGWAAEPLDPVMPPEAIHVVQWFAEPIATAEMIDHWLERLIPQLTQALAQAGQGARVLLFIADRVDGRPQPIRIGFARPNRDPAHILRLIRRRIEEIDPGYGIDALHLHVRRADPLDAQPFDETLETAAPDLGGLIDLLANRAVATWREMPLESDVPERSVGRCSAIDPPARGPARPKRDDVRRLDARETDHPWHPCRPRPARLLRRPEPLDHVMAELPDQPPRRFTWRGKTYVVLRADGPERIAGEWWKSAAERAAVRDYFTVEDDSGGRFWIFRRGDGEHGATGDLSWYLHGRFG